MHAAQPRSMTKTKLGSQQRSIHIYCYCYASIVIARDAPVNRTGAEYALHIIFMHLLTFY